MPASSMRGLTVFIADMRNCRTREQEQKRINKELVNIRAKFKEGNISGYHKRKYVCKLLYIYILGWPVDFGHLEAVNLISSPRYSEKQIGYLAVSLLLTETHEMTRLVINSVKKDLESGNEYAICLALHGVANIAGSEMSESLAPAVMKLVISMNSPPFVVKKASLCMLRMVRKFPEAFAIDECRNRLEQLIDHSDLGVAVCVSSLVAELALNHPRELSGCIPRAVERLSRIVIGSQYSAEDVYYKVPAPWLQVKLLLLLRSFGPEEISPYAPKIEGIIAKILRTCQEFPRHLQQKNAQNSVLLEAMQLMVNAIPDSDLMLQALDLFGRYLGAKETNLRYFSLQVLADLAERVQSIAPIQKYQEAVILALRDRDISVRRKALKVIFAISDGNNVQHLVTELLKQLQIADATIRDEIVLKIFLLTDEFTKNAKDGDPWYVQVMLQLIMVAKGNVNDKVWHHVVQTVTNAPSLRQDAAEKAFLILRHVERTNSPAVKVSCYLLGEYAGLIGNVPGSSFRDIFVAVRRFLNGVDSHAQAIILSTLLKLAQKHPPLISDVRAAITPFSASLETDLQQRACEYLMLLSTYHNLLPVVTADMPEFSKEVKDDVMMNLRSEDLPDRYVAQPSDLPSTAVRSVRRTTSFRRPQSSATNARSRRFSRASTAPPLRPLDIDISSATNQTPSQIQNLGDVKPLDLLGMSSEETEPSHQQLEDPAVSPGLAQNLGFEVLNDGSTTLENTANPFYSEFGDEGFVPVPEEQPIPMPWDDVGFKAALWNEGIIRQEWGLQIGYKGTYEPASCRFGMVLYLGNSNRTSVESLRVTFRNDFRASGPSHAVVHPESNYSGMSVPPLNQIQYGLSIECAKPFRGPPEVVFEFRMISQDTGVPKSYVIQCPLPVAIFHFANEVTNMRQEEFVHYESQFGAPLEQRVVLQRSIESTVLSTLLTRLHVFPMVSSVDGDVLGVTSVFTSEDGQVGALIRIQNEPSAVTLRCYSLNAFVTEVFAEVISNALLLGTRK